MDTSAFRRAAARVRGVKRPIAVLIAAAIGLGGVGVATGMALGAVGDDSLRPHIGRGHVHDDDGLRPRLRVQPAE
jgi:hypothetical protein